jgi:hypothetical protein
MKSKYNIIGNPPSSSVIRKRLLNFIDNVLPEFKVRSTDNSGNLKTSEDAITEDLADFLDYKQESLKQDPNLSFKFTNQSQTKADIGVKWGRVYAKNNSKLYCWIEAKRLPTPKTKDRDEREYVIVNKEKFESNGGIQRFKEGKHAPELSYSIMIGYIQDNNNVDYWLSKINIWITELANTNNGFWNKKECLKKDDSSKCVRFLSIHKRKDETEITLYHYWIKL